MDDMELLEIKEKLKSKKSNDRKRAAKEIGKSIIVELGADLYLAYLKEVKDVRTWELQCEMIKSLGLIGHREALDTLEKLIKQNKSLDMITTVAASSYIRLTRGSSNDGKCVVDLIDEDNLSVITGVLLVLAIDKMIPSEEEIRKIINKCWDINKHKDRVGNEYGIIDARQYLAIACANWDIKLTRDFLNHCKETAYNVDKNGKIIENGNLKAVCENSLKGKFSKSYLP